MSLLATLEAHGVTLALIDGKLRAYGELTDELRAVIREHRDELLATLAESVPVPQFPSGAAATPTSPIKHTHRRALANAPPPGPLTNGQQGPLSFLYSVLRNGRVERGTFTREGIRTEPEALAFLRQRYPGLTVQWVRLITHPACSGCRYYTGGVLCNADRAPDYAAVVGSCGEYERAGEL